MIGSQTGCYSTSRLVRRRGFSLLEVLLALGLTVILVAGIGMAVRLHLVTLAKQQREIESKQVARSVLMMITNDVRAAMQYRAQDFSSLENLQVSESMILGIGAAVSEDVPSAGGDLAGGDLADQAAGAAGEGSAGGENGETGESEEAPSFGDPEAEACVSCRPTFFGNADSILVDASRLPRIDEYNPLIATGNDQVQLPSDVKSIAYFVSDEAPFGATSGFSNNAAGGLYRRQIDRAVAAYLGESGDTYVDQYAKMVAPEVAKISLRYFNGEDWTDAWDSEADGGFPPAVEVLLVIDSSRANSESGNYQYGGFDPETMQMYRTVIHLPTAELGGQQE